MAAARGRGAAARHRRSGDSRLHQAITVAETRRMNYVVFVTSGGGTTKIAANEAVTAPAGFVASGGATAAGAFKVTGSNNCTVLISFITGTRIGPGAAMPIRNFATDAAWRGADIRCRRRPRRQCRP